MASSAIAKPCSYVKNSLPKGVFLDLLTEGSRTREFFDKIPSDKWAITSFNPTSRVVCIAITTDHGAINTISVTLNYLSEDKSITPTSSVAQTSINQSVSNSTVSNANITRYYTQRSTLPAF